MTFPYFIPKFLYRWCSTNSRKAFGQASWKEYLNVDWEDKYITFALILSWVPFRLEVDDREPNIVKPAMCVWYAPPQDALIVVFLCPEGWSRFFWMEAAAKDLSLRLKLMELKCKVLVKLKWRSIIAMKWERQSKWCGLIDVNALDTSWVKLRLN